MPTNQEKLDYIVAPEFKRDIFNGVSPQERGGRSDFIKEFMNFPVAWYGFNGQSQPADKRNTVTLAAVLGWLDTGLSVLNAGVQANSKKLDMVLAALAANPADSLKQSIHLQSGGTATVASVLADIQARPVGGTVAAAATIDLEALATLITANLTASLKAQINK